MVRLAREMPDGLGRHLGIGAGAQMLALVDELRPQVIRVHQRAVVGQRDERVVDGGDMRLGRLPGGLPAARGIAHVPDGHHAPASVASSKTWVTSPKSFASMTVEPSPTAMPALSWPRCCRACSP